MQKGGWLNDAIVALYFRYVPSDYLLYPSYLLALLIKFLLVLFLTFLQTSDGGLHPGAKGADSPHLFLFRQQPEIKEKDPPGDEEVVHQGWCRGHLPEVLPPHPRQH